MQRIFHGRTAASEANREAVGSRDGEAKLTA